MAWGEFVETMRRRHAASRMRLARGSVFAITAAANTEFVESHADKGTKSRETAGGNSNPDFDCGPDCYSNGVDWVVS